MAVVTSNGERASRFRLLLRSLIVWSPLVGVPIILALLAPLLPDLGQFDLKTSQLDVLTPYFLIGGGIHLVLVVASLLIPRRGLPDRITRTYLVPR